MKNFLAIFFAASLLWGCAATGGTGSARFAPAIHNPLPDGTFTLLAGFEEDECLWKADGRVKSGDTSQDAEISGDWASEGNQSCVWSFSRTQEQESATFSCDSLPTCDWSRGRHVVADFNNISRAPVEISLRIESGSKPYACGTQRVVLGAGENENVMFDIRHDLEGDIDAGRVIRISFVIHGAHRGGSIYADNIRLVR